MFSRAAVVHEKEGPYIIENIEVDSPKQNEVLVKIVGCGLCHTDELARQQAIPVQLPAVFGHEGSGIVVEVGSAVTTVKKGDHVVLSYSSCGHCETCLDGKPYVCRNDGLLNFGGKMADGTTRLHQNGKDLSNFFGHSSFSEYAVANERNVVVVGKDADLRFLGPLGCGFQTGAGTVLNALRPKFGSSIVIFGNGSVGSAATMAAKIMGCQTIIAVDIVDQKLELAKQIGATHTINSKTSDVVEEIKSITNGGANYTIETTGIPALLNQALYSLRTNGTCGAVGVCGDTTINIFDAIMMEGRTLHGFIQGNAVPQLFIPKLVEYFKAGMFPIDKLITLYNLDQINEAFENTHAGKTIKGVVLM